MDLKNYRLRRPPDSGPRSSRLAREPEEIANQLDRKKRRGDVHFKEKSTGEVLSVFTTRPDTLFGATYMVLAPEHPLVNQVTTPSQKAAVQNYQKQTSAKSDLDRTDLNKDKTGVFTGGLCHQSGE